MKSIPRITATFLLLALAAGYANQTGDLAASADDSVATEETESAIPQTKTRGHGCKNLPTCVAGGVGALGMIGVFATMLAIAAPFAILESASEQWPASDTEERGIPAESVAH
ncbi:MAG: hypothetical protein ACE5GT_02075 [Rhodospirillales bacterium]